MIRLNIGSYLEQKNITPYRLVKESGLAPNTVYTLARSPAKRVDLDTLGSIVNALTRLTGQPVTPNDLLEVIEDEVKPDPVDTWLTSSATDLKAMLEDVERDEDPQDLTKWSKAFTQAAQ